MIKIRFVVAYDGTEFCGWQRQAHMPNPSVQQILEDALGQMFSQKIVLFASGRTDAGVHAVAQVCHFKVDVPESRFDNWDFAWAMRALLPPSVVIKQAWFAPMDFHATLSATHKTYRYLIYVNRRNNPFLRQTTYWLHRDPDLEHLQACADRLLGEHDFKSFQTTGTPVMHTVRTIRSAKWTRKSKNLIQFEVTGSGFLKQMVRNIVGTQLKLEKEGKDPSEITRIIEAKDRRAAGPSAPPHGLFLWKVYYPHDLDIRCRPLYNKPLSLKKT